MNEIDTHSPVREREVCAVGEKHRMRSDTSLCCDGDATSAFHPGDVTPVSLRKALSGLEPRRSGMKRSKDWRVAGDNIVTSPAEARRSRLLSDSIFNLLVTLSTKGDVIKQE